jgi:hypothetical protein
MQNVLICVLFVVTHQCVPINIVMTHVNIVVVGVLTHPLIEQLMVQRWSQVFILCLVTKPSCRGLSPSVMIENIFKRVEYFKVVKTMSTGLYNYSICLMCGCWKNISPLLPLSFPEKEKMQAQGRNWKSKWI